MSDLRRISWSETRRRLRADRLRLREVRAELAPFPEKGERWTSAYFSVWLYRVSNYFYRANHRWLARVVWHFNVLLTGADISEPADIAEGFVVLHPPGTSIMGRAGVNFTIMAASGVGGEVGRFDDIAGWPGVPLIGDDVVMEPHTGVFGPVTVGNRVRICSGAMITRDIPDDTIVESPRVKTLHNRQAETQ